MLISLIGMSGAGKSAWSMKLGALGYRRFCCDDLIAEKLGSELMRAEGTSMQIGEWMGFPYEPRYKERESSYLDCEKETLAEIVGYLESVKGKPEKDVVVDTTGSVIYTGEKMMARLGSNTTIVLLSTPAEVQTIMLKAYIDNRRPVLWRGMFIRNADETNEEALARCYPDLLAAREQMYERYADVTIDYYTRTQDDFGISDFLEMITSKTR